MKKILNEPLTFFLIYIIMFVFTFGHAYNGVPDEEGERFGGQTYAVHNGPGIKGGRAIFAAAFWPLYWSIEFQEKK